MMMWFRKLLRAPAAAPLAVTATAATNGGSSTAPEAAADRGAVPVPLSSADRRLEADALASMFVEWQLQCEPTRTTPLGPRELRATHALDSLIEGGELPPELLPRQSSVVPQLLALLRKEGVPVGRLTERIGKDIMLATEVMRVAGSAHYRARAAGPVTDLAQAVTALGNDGLQRAIARVALRPIFEASAQGLAVSAGARLWEHAQRKATLCADLAARQGLDPFDGYLAALIHNTGWLVAWRALDRMEGSVQPPFSQSFVRQLTLRKDRLFALVCAPWEKSLTLIELAGELRERGLAQASSPLATALATADRDRLAA